MSKIQDELKKSKEAYFVLEVDKDGSKRYFSSRYCTIPYSAGDDIQVDGLILNSFKIGATLNLRSFSHNFQSVSVKFANKEKLQNLDHFFEGATGQFFIYCAGLDWADIKEDGKLFKGQVVKKDHTDTHYNITVEDFLKYLGDFNAPLITWGNVSDYQTWNSGHASTVEGSPYPIIFGNPGLAPLYRAHDGSNWRKIAMWGETSAADADYDADLLVPYDSDGAEIAWNNTLDFISSNYSDEQGNQVVTFYGSSGNVIPNASFIEIYGYSDNADGAYSGAANTVLENPGHVVHYILREFAGIPKADVDIASMNTVASYTPDIRLDMGILSSTEKKNVIVRLGKQCVFSLYQNGGKAALFAMDVNGSPIGSINTDIDATGKVSTGKTPDDMVVNQVRLKGDYNRMTSSFGYVDYVSGANNVTCGQSEKLYGKRPERTIEVIDIADDYGADSALKRYLAIYAFRHDLLSFFMPVANAWDLQEGFVYKITCPDGPGVNGWVDEPFILLDKIDSSKGVTMTKWWRQNV